MTRWPELTAARDHETLAILHLAAQMLGKLRVAYAPWVNHGWHVALRPVARGLATAPTDAGDGRFYTLTIDLCCHSIRLAVSDGGRAEVSLAAPRISDLHSGLLTMLKAHRLPAQFDGLPSEVEGAVRFADDHAKRLYSEDSAERLRDALALIVPLFERFRAGFAGKASPVHLFWGAFDLAVTRFSGRVAPPHPGGVPGLPDRITREAYSHEVSSAGFWPGGMTAAEPMFYSYAYPEPAGFRQARVAHAEFDDGLGEYVLPYAIVRDAADPGTMLSAFLETSYAAAADLGHWDRHALERAASAP